MTVFKVVHFQSFSFQSFFILIYSLFLCCPKALVRLFSSQLPRPKNIFSTEGKIDKMLKPSSPNCVRGVNLKCFERHFKGGSATVRVQLFMDSTATIEAIPVERNRFQQKYLGDLVLGVHLEHVVGDSIASYLVDFHKLLSDDEVDSLVMDEGIFFMSQEEEAAYEAADELGEVYRGDEDYHGVFFGKQALVKSLMDEITSAEHFDYSSEDDLYN